MDCANFGTGDAVLSPIAAKLELNHWTGREEENGAHHLRRW